MYTLPTNAHVFWLILALQSAVPGSCDTGFILRPQLAACQTLKAWQHRMCLCHQTEICCFICQRPEGWYGQSQITTGGRIYKLSMESIECFALSRFTIHLPQDELNEAVATLWDPQISPSHPGFKTRRNKNSKDRCLYLGWLRGGAMGQSSPNHNKSFFHGDLLHGRLSEVYSILCGMECTSRSCLLWVCYIRCWVRWPRRKHIVIIVMWCEKRVQTFDSLLLYWISNFSGSCHVLHLVPVPMRRMCTSTWFSSLEVCPRRLAADLSWV